MKYKTVQEAINEAERFIEAAKKVKPYMLYGNQCGWIDAPSPYNAGCKRASMDLTRVLARMRRGE